MPTTSQSGYEFVTDYGDPRLISNPTVPGSSTKILGGMRKAPVATVLLYFAARFNAEVEALGVDPTSDDWGFDPQHNNTTTRSNHKSGTAEDLNSTRHPQHQRGTFSAGQYATMRRIAQDLADVAGQRVLRLGIDWSDDSVDEMHVEIAPDLAGTGVVESAAAAIRAGRVPNVPTELLDTTTTPTSPTKPTAPSIPLEEDDMYNDDDRKRDQRTHDRVEYLHDQFTDVYPDPAGNRNGGQRSLFRLLASIKTNLDALVRGDRK